jgi:tetratricopeptide (TPR) repeat protein
MGPKAIVLPFGVRESDRGLGIGLAAMVHSIARLGGESLALAQLHQRKDDGSAPTPVEAFIPPPAWSDLSRSGAASSEGLEVVLTGAFEPPGEGDGTVALLAYDPRSGEIRAKVERPIDDRHAGKSLVAALREFTGVELSLEKEIAELDWTALESILRAERCAVADPVRGGPHDPLAALAHLERAVSDAPLCLYPAARLAQLAIELGAPGGSVAAAALRALLRASLDAPERADLLEAAAALSLRTGDPISAEARALAAIAISNERPHVHALVSEARRVRNDFDGALAAVNTGLQIAPNDPILLTELGIVSAVRSDPETAQRTWISVLDRLPGFLPAYMNLGTLALERSDTVLMQKLVDHALAVRGAHPDMMRRAVQLAAQGEPEGVARATRISSLARSIVDRVPDDFAARVILARSLAELGERDVALEHLAMVERSAAGSPAAAEAQRGRLLLREPATAQVIDALLAQAENAPAPVLADVAARARRLSMQHGSWVAAFAEGIAEKRAGRPAAAREAFLRALEYAPGCQIARAELVLVLLGLGDGLAADEHARRLRTIEGDTPRTLKLLARVKAQLGNAEEARALAERVLATNPDDEDCLRIVKPPQESWLKRLLRR